MKKRNVARNRQTAKNRSALNSKYLLLSALCGLVLIGSFFFAARQHFSSWDFSIQNSRLRKQVEDLESDKRRLQLARQMSLAPAEIKKAAKKFGFTDMPDSLEFVRISQTADTAKIMKTVGDKPAAGVKLVQKTVQSAAVSPDERSRKVMKSEPVVRDRRVQIAGR